MTYGHGVGAAGQRPGGSTPSSRRAAGPDGGGATAGGAAPFGGAALFDTVAPVDVAQGRMRGGWLFAAVWLVYLVPVLQDAWARPEPWRRALGLASALAFAAQYVWSWVALRRLRKQGVQLPALARVAVLAGANALVLLAAVAVGEEALGMLVFTAVQALFVLPARRALALVAAAVAVTIVAPLAVPGWEPDAQLPLGVVLASVAMWGVLQVVRRNAELARAHQRIAELAVQTERTRFARDLHDILGHSLTVLTVKAELAGRLVTIDPARAELEIGEVEQLAREALTDVRAAVSGYREVSLPGELASARAALEAAGIAAELPGSVDEVPAERRELLAWALREGVTNAVRHSAARHVWIRLGRNGVEIADDGRGPAGDPGAVGVRGHGLAGLRERAAAAGAGVTVRHRDGGGFVLRVGWLS